MRGTRGFTMALVLGLALLALVAGCGGSDESSSTEPAQGGSSGTPAKTITIDETEFKLSPATVNLSQPGTYEFKAVNNGSTQHALEIEGNGVEDETETIGPGDTASVTVELTEEGSYEMYCPVGDHKDRGMEGTVVVGSGGGATTEDSTTTEDTDSDSDSGGYG
jgi:plastocyanin